MLASIYYSCLFVHNYSKSDIEFQTDFKTHFPNDESSIKYFYISVGYFLNSSFEKIGKGLDLFSDRFYFLLLNFKNLLIKI